MRLQVLLSALVWLTLAGTLHAQDRPWNFSPSGPFASKPVLNAGTAPAFKLQIDGANNDSKNGNGGEKPEEPPEHIKDNSFLVEEAYNQEAGVVQHIFNWVHFWDKEAGVRTNDFVFNYIMELPICSQTHQFSFVLPFQHFYEREAGLLPDEEGGIGDILLNYRYQLLMDDPCTCQPAVAPRFSLIVPSGDEDRGLGTGELGYQFNLPISKEVDPFSLNFNAGFTYVPGVSTLLEVGIESPGRDLRSFNLGGSVIYLMNYDFNLMLELVAFWNEELDELGNRDRTFELILNPGFRCAVFTGEEVQWVLGASVPIGLSDDAPDIGVFAYMSVEHNFKKLNGNGANGE